MRLRECSNLHKDGTKGKHFGELGPAIHPAPMTICPQSILERQLRVDLAHSWPGLE
jgi:hypothetical protein